MEGGLVLLVGGGLVMLGRGGLVMLGLLVEWRGRGKSVVSIGVVEVAGVSVGGTGLEIGGSVGGAGLFALLAWFASASTSSSTALGFAFASSALVLLCGFAPVGLVLGMLRVELRLGHTHHVCVIHTCARVVFDVERTDTPVVYPVLGLSESESRGVRVRQYGWFCVEGHPCIGVQVHVLTDEVVREGQDRGGLVLVPV